MKTLCAHCNAPIDRPPSRLLAYKHHFCSHKCASEFKRTLTPVVCAICGAQMVLKKSRAQKGKHACSPECLAELRARNLVHHWNSGKSRTAQCAHCGQTFIRKPSQLAKYARSFCSRECKALGQHGPHPEMRTGQWYSCEMCGKPVWRTPAIKEPHVFCSRECCHKGQGILQPKLKGPDNPAWKGGRSMLPYTEGFDKALKAAIKERDKHRCQICGNSRNAGLLAVHHVDESKNNHDPSNLITLCLSCHRKVHHKTTNLPMTDA